MLIFFEVLTNKRESIVGAESADGLDDRDRGSAVLKTPQPPNSLLSISTLGLSPGAALSSNPARETTAGEKDTTKQMQSAAGYCA